WVSRGLTANPRRLASGTACWKSESRLVRIGALATDWPKVTGGGDDTAPNQFPPPGGVRRWCGCPVGNCHARQRRGACQAGKGRGDLHRTAAPIARLQHSDEPDGSLPL